MTMIQPVGLIRLLELTGLIELAVLVRLSYLHQLDLLALSLNWKYFNYL